MNHFPNNPLIDEAVKFLADFRSSRSTGPTEDASLTERIVNLFNKQEKCGYAMLMVPRSFLLRRLAKHIGPEEALTTLEKEDISKVISYEHILLNSGITSFPLITGEEWIDVLTALLDFQTENHDSLVNYGIASIERPIMEWGLSYFRFLLPNDIQKNYLDWLYNHVMVTRNNARAMIPTDQVCAGWLTLGDPRISNDVDLRPFLTPSMNDNMFADGMSLGVIRQKLLMLRKDAFQALIGALRIGNMTEFWRDFDDSARRTFGDASYGAILLAEKRSFGHVNRVARTSKMESIYRISPSYTLKTGGPISLYYFTSHVHFSCIDTTYTGSISNLKNLKLKNEFSMYMDLVHTPARKDLDGILEPLVALLNSIGKDKNNSNLLKQDAGIGLESAYAVLTDIAIDSSDSVDLNNMVEPTQRVAQMVKKGFCYEVAGHFNFNSSNRELRYSKLSKKIILTGPQRDLMESLCKVFNEGEGVLMSEMYPHKIPSIDSFRSSFQGARQVMFGRGRLINEIPIKSEGKITDRCCVLNPTAEK